MATKLTREEEALRKRGRKEAEKRNKRIMQEERKREKAERKEMRKRERAERREAKKREREEKREAKRLARNGIAREEDKEPIKVEETAVSAEEVKENPAEVEQGTEETAPEQTEEKKPQKRNYHVSLREDGKWQVKFAKGAKALKLFDTQAEAIAFAKEKAERQDGSITIHKKDGKIRKQNYSKKSDK